MITGPQATPPAGERDDNDPSPLVPADRHTVVFRPSRERFRPVWRYAISVVGVVVGLVLLIALIGFRGSVAETLGAALPILVVVGATLTFIVALKVRPRIIVSPDTVVVRRLTWGRVTNRSELGTAVLVTLRQPFPNRLSNPETTGIRLYLLRSNGSRMANLGEELWGLDQFETIIRALDVQVDRVGELSPKQLRRRYKGAVPWAATHVATATVLGVIGLFVLCLLVLALVWLGP